MRRARRGCRGSNGDRTLASANGGRSARTTARTVTRGTRPGPVARLSLGRGNGKDPILKERLFGLTNSEGNHGEDVKEYYFYLDSTPTHSYMKSLLSG